MALTTGDFWEQTLSVRLSLVAEESTRTYSSNVPISRMVRNILLLLTNMQHRLFVFFLIVFFIALRVILCENLIHIFTVKIQSG